MARYPGDRKNPHAGVISCYLQAKLDFNKCFSDFDSEVGVGVDEVEPTPNKIEQNFYKSLKSPGRSPEISF